MDPISLGVTLAGLIAAKALERGSDEVVDVGARGVGGLIARVRERLAGKDEASVGQALARVDDAPDSPSRERDLAGALGALFERDRELYGEVRGLVEQAEREGLQLSGPIAQTATANTAPVAQVAGNVSGVNISQGGANGGGADGIAHATRG